MLANVTQVNINNQHMHTMIPPYDINQLKRYSSSFVKPHTYVEKNINLALQSFSMFLLFYLHCMYYSTVENRNQLENQMPKSANQQIPM